MLPLHRRTWNLETSSQDDSSDDELRQGDEDCGHHHSRMALAQRIEDSRIDLVYCQQGKEKSWRNQKQRGAGRGEDGSFRLHDPASKREGLSVQGAKDDPEDDK